MTNKSAIVDAKFINSRVRTDLRANRNVGLTARAQGRRKIRRKIKNRFRMRQDIHERDSFVRNDGTLFQMSRRPFPIRKGRFSNGKLLIIYRQLTELGDIDNFPNRCHGRSSSWSECHPSRDFRFVKI